MSEESEVSSLDMVNSTANPFEGMTQKETISKLFNEGGVLESGPKGKFMVGEDTRNLLALFSDGTFLVSDTHKFDGRVLSFQSLVRKKGGKINRPLYVSMSMITSVYSNDARGGEDSRNTAGEASNQMQKDFVDIVYRASDMKVSDIHVVVADHTTVMFRVAGSMQTILEYDKAWGEAFVRSVFASADISDSNYAQNEFQAAQKMGSTPLRGEKDLYLPENVLAIRLQFNPVAFGTRYLVMRLLYSNSSSTKDDNLKELGFSDYEDIRLYKMRSFPTGLCIIAGPTGSGKSTTLSRNMSRMLKEANYELNLITVEDPPEYPISGARQLPVTNATTEEEKEAAFNLALAASLRSDPDAIMVGEIRTLSSAELTFKAALSGHNVWATLHANSAPAIISRLLDMGVDAFKLKDSELIRGLLSQRLFKKLCPKCREPIKNHPEHPSYPRLEEALGQYGLDQSYVRGKGCSFCNGKGIIGRIVAAEMIIPDMVFLEKIVNHSKKEAVHYWTNELSGRTLKEDAIEKMLRGLIAIDEVERWCGLIDLDAAY
ncbi:MAG: Flp pilus assembly complex ATPase component TadA [Rickettsiales bacterium]|jgi:type II secretory ATPase GspE/PulE/Tfp pilus assembly ATPase PilB-like protein|nr:Flp pilus assembly complex ATPase component TadA [Rickettsiales bacterium]